MGVTFIHYVDVLYMSTLEIYCAICSITIYITDEYNIKNLFII